MRVLALAIVLFSPAVAQARLDLDRLERPPGFSIEVFADDVPNARSMTLGARGTLFVGTRDKGNVYAVVHDGKRATGVSTIARRLKSPNGVAFRDGALYVAEINRVLRYDGIEDRLDDPPDPVVLKDDYPTDGHHGWKFIAFGPDGKLYVPVGAPCNICAPGERHALISRIEPDGSRYEVVARGVRNTVGFDWNPADGKLWFTDNGRDWLGDDQPPCELNRVAEPGQHFGYPYCHGGDIADPEFGGDAHPCADFVAPQVRFGAHTAPLGMRFYTGAMFPEEYRGDIFVAQHGSWNRSRKTGYQVVRVVVEDGVAVKSEAFVHGWLRGEETSGRPVDVLVMPDGALLVSDDQSGAIYRVTYAAGAGGAR
jgi:glucose/arabinose dehydrogenase